MKLFNSMTMKKEDFVPLEEGKVKMYACGPDRIQLYPRRQRPAYDYV